MKHNLPVYNFPETIFVAQNTPEQQIEHVISESDEVIEAIYAQDDNHIEELADLTHSLETFWRRIERDHGQEYVQQIFAKVEEKNRIRGYYAKEGIDEQKS